LNYTRVQTDARRRTAPAFRSSPRPDPRPCAG